MTREESVQVTMSYATTQSYRWSHLSESENGSQNESYHNIYHVPGKQHGPNGLSWQPHQTGDLSDKEYDLENFDDWVDNLSDFSHVLNPSAPTYNSVRLLHAFTMKLAHQQPEDTSNSNRQEPELEYIAIP